jgi:hypothetical protein
MPNSAGFRATTVPTFDPFMRLPSIGSRTGSPASGGTGILRAPCYLTATINGKEVPFDDSRQKFEELSKSWQEYNFGSSIIEYHDAAFEQIIGMGAEVVPYLLERLKDGEVEWVYALQRITGHHIENPDMIGDAEKVAEAWIEWGRENVHPTGQAC